MKGIKNRGSQVHGRYKSKPKYREYHDDIDYDRDEYLDNRELREFYDFINKYRVSDIGTN